MQRLKGHWMSVTIQGGNLSAHYASSAFVFSCLTSPVASKFCWSYYLYPVLQTRLGVPIILDYFESVTIFNRDVMVTLFIFSLCKCTWRSDVSSWRRAPSFSCVLNFSCVHKYLFLSRRLLGRLILCFDFDSLVQFIIRMINNAQCLCCH